MNRLIAGLIAGSLVTLAVLVLVSDILFAPTYRELVEDWQKLRPGMNHSDVEQLLGTPTYTFMPGDDFPPWAVDIIAETHEHNYGLWVYRVGTVGPCLLLVFTDKGGRVIFVTSVHT